jgi:hypothetical protein
VLEEARRRRVARLAGSLAALPPGDLQLLEGAADLLEAISREQAARVERE